MVAKHWEKLLGSYECYSSWEMSVPPDQQGEAKTFSVLWNFTRPPGFLCFTFLYGETATMKNMFHREEEKLTFWQWNTKPFAAESHCSEIRDRNKCLHNWQIKIWTASCSIFRCKNNLFMVMSVFILQQNMEKQGKHQVSLVKHWRQAIPFLFMILYKPMTVPSPWLHTT